MRLEKMQIIQALTKLRFNSSWVTTHVVKKTLCSGCPAHLRTLIQAGIDPQFAGNERL